MSLRHHLAALLFVLSSATWADVEGIVNKTLPVREVTREQARNIYLLRERVGPYGNRPQLFRLPLDSRTHREFITHILGMTVDQFEKEWRKLVNAGLATEIEEVASQREMLAAVARKPRGVGYLDRDYLVLNVAGHDVEIVRIIHD